MIYFFDERAIGRTDIVMLGDSLTAAGCWRQRFPDLPLRNRGIPGDTVAGVRGRLAAISVGRPRAIFLMIGTNDLSWVPDLLAGDLLVHYEAILVHLRRQTPATRVFVQSILPRQASYAGRIRALNGALKALAASYDCTYLDLYHHFAAPDQNLRAEFSGDDLHLTPAGYEKWAELLAPHLAACAQSRSNHHHEEPLS